MADWAHVKQIVADALELDEETRETYLEGACRDDAALGKEVRSLLSFSTGDLGVLDRPPGGWPADAGEPTLVGACVGDYRIVRQLAEGGMGVVFEAEQQQPRRLVALKVVRSGLMTTRVQRRFRDEVEALGRLQHRAIAQIFDAGLHRDRNGAVPYFVMELVRGEPLTTYVRAAAMSLDARLELMAEVCDGVHHAHQRGVIHRDLKAANILVTEAGQPKILDFGVARALGNADRRSDRTHEGQLVGTLVTMSPEQAGGDPDAVDVRSDVYALGALLFEVLAGRPPLQVATRPIPEALRMIQEDEPPRLGALDRALRGDVEVVVSKALEKDRARRYQSASELAADLRRILRHEPVMARPPTTAYQVRKFARRNRSLVVAAGAVTLALIGGVGISTIGFVRAVAARDEARTAERRAAAVSGFLQSMLGSADPAALGGDVTVRQVLELAGARIEAEFPEDPQVQAELHSTIGWTWYGLGDLALAERHLRQSVTLFERTLGPDAARTLDDHSRLVHVLLHVGHLDDAEELLRRALETADVALGSDHPTTLAVGAAEALLLQEQGALDAAALRFEEIVAADTRVLGPAHAQTQSAMNNHAGVLLELGRYADARNVLEALLTRRVDALGEEHPLVLVTRTNLAAALEGLGLVHDAETLYRQVLRAGADVWPATHPTLLTARANLVGVLAQLGLMDEALSLSAEVMEARRRTLGADHESTLAAVSNHCDILLRLGRGKEAAEDCRRAAEGLARQLGDDHPRSLIAAVNHASVLHETGDLEAASSVMESLRPRLEAVFGAEHIRTLVLMNNLAMLRLDQQRPDVGARLLETVLRRCPADPATAVERVIFHRNLGRCLMAGDDLDRAERHLLISRALAETVGPDHPALARTIELLDELRRRQQDQQAPTEAPERPSAGLRPSSSAAASSYSATDLTAVSRGSAATAACTRSP